MPVTLYTVFAQAAGFEDNALSVYQSGAQLMGGKDQVLSVYHVSAQRMYIPLPIVNLQSIAAQVMMRAEVDPLTGGYQHPEKYLHPIEVEDMIYTDIIFPECITYGSTGVPRYETVKSEVLSGDEARQSRWTYPKHEYNISMEGMNAKDISEIMNIWHVCSGDLIGFLFTDPLDHTSALSINNLSGSDVTSQDQFVASAVGGQTDYEVYKFYVKGDRQKKRRIRYPKKDTMLVRVGHRDTTQFEVNYDDAVLRFTTPVEDEVITVTKVGAVVTRDDAGAWTEFFNVGDFVNLEGFTNTLNDATANALRVAAIDGDDMTLELFNGSTWGADGDEASVAITFNSGLPATGQNISAGFYFYVPVRFDDGDNATSEIIAGLRESSVADFSDISLKEIFE